MPEVKCFLNLEDGQVLKLPPGDEALPQVRSDTKTYAPVEAIPSRIQYQWLDSFINSVEEEALRARMEAAINGKGAFRRFKDILLTLPDERRRWFEFRDEMMRQRVVDWLREVGVDALNPPPWEEEGEESLAIGEPGNSAPVEKKPIVNNQVDIEALRDFLIEWAEGVDPAKALNPITLEDLAQRVGDRFHIKVH